MVDPRDDQVMTENTQTSAGPGTWTPPTATTAPPTPRPPLRRSRTDRKVAGVCGGVAASLGIDPVILRVVTVVLAVFGGSGLLLYAAGWLLLPEEGTDRSEGQRFVDRNGTAVAVIVAVAAGLLLVGAVVGLGLGAGPWPGSGPGVWPLLVVGAVGLAIWLLTRTPTGPPSAPPAPVPPSTPEPMMSEQTTAEQATTTLAVTGPTPTPPTAPAYPPAGGYPTSPPPPTPPTPGAPWSASTPPAPAAPPRPRSVLGLVTVSVAAIAAGVLVALDRTGDWDLDWVVLLAVLTGIVGLGLVVGALFGRARGLIALGIVLALLTAGAASVPGNGRSGDVRFAPPSVSAVPADGYRWGAGTVRLDLTQLPLTGTTVAIDAQLGVGQLIVEVPDDARLVLTAKTGIGTIRLPGGDQRDGFGQTVQTTIEPVGTPSGTLDLTLDLGIGDLEVRRVAS